MLEEFFPKYPVFSTSDLKRFQAAHGSRNSRATESLMAYHTGTGRVIRVKRGLYAVVPKGLDAASYIPDPFILASKMADDAVLAYHTALEFHGRAYSAFNRFTFQSNCTTRPVVFKDFQFQRVTLPYSLQHKGKTDIEVILAEKNGMEIRVTSLERTLVDILDRPTLSGSWEEIWRSLESVEFFDLDRVVEYTKLLGNAATAAKVGFFLEQNKKTLMVNENNLKPLWQMRPRQARYFDRAESKNSRLIKRWNLIVPKEILKRSWAEVI